MSLAAPKPSRVGSPSRVAPLGYFSTGVGVVRLAHRDQPFSEADLEVVLAHGGDWSPQPLTLHKQLPGGRFDPIPSWFSNDYDHHAGIAIGDLRGSGYEDVVVAVMAGKNRDVSGGGVKVYYGTPRGLDPNPVWIARGFAAFGIAIADLRGSGRLDVIAGSLWDGGTLHKPQRRGADYFDGALRILENQGNVRGRSNFRERLIDLPACRGAADVCPADVDFDGRFELVCGGTRTGVIYGEPQLGTWEASHGWLSEEAHPFSFSVRAFMHPGYRDGMLVASSRGLFSVSQLRGRPLSTADACVLIHRPESHQASGRAIQKLRLPAADEVPAGLSLMSDSVGAPSLAVGFLSADPSMTRGALVRIYRGAKSRAPFENEPEPLEGAHLMAAALSSRAVRVAPRESEQRRCVTVSGGQQVFTFAPHELGQIVSVEVKSHDERSTLYSPASERRAKHRYTTVPSGDWISLCPRAPAGSEVVITSRSVQETALVAASSAAWPPVGASTLWLCPTAS